MYVWYTTVVTILNVSRVKNHMQMYILNIVQQ